MILTFWILLGLILYCYFGYPLCLLVVSKFFAKPVKKEMIQPSISILMSVWNEEDVIRKKITNLLALDYPSEKIEIIIGSDGSDDHTNEIVRSFTDQRIQFIERKDRRGKMLMINELVRLANHEIIVFNDARQELPEDALTHLVSNFADPQVGCVSGELVFQNVDGTTAKGINLYWEYEKMMRNHEARIHSMLGATGAMYAIRRELFKEIPSNVILDDMYVPFRMIERGYRAVFEPMAKAYDKPAYDSQEEYRRKTRTLFGNFQIFQIFGHLFNPFTSPIAWPLFSHKFLRVLAPILMIGLISINLFLLTQPFYKLIFSLQIIFYIMAIIGLFSKNSTNTFISKVSKLCYIPYIFCLLNFSVLVGFWRFLYSNQSITWEKARKV